ncbi:alkaline phosphatase family protein [Hoyosella subflava]|uniref:Type I phosphodiesterase/nucleotide pyrophosphatase n=1 Tax=Hoyosella subflava (strain DSM 45089 / JCM 17490 / NBRC 109087 / DQS3-9A1) TaxID=443218 RepID=F6EFP5_HOYSD|nr:nucleotide pyrophosphatase/phosphodiesterase family protein [Hoyosella subflava]AEF40974.1 Type I phosphodiesterase/nucleotide pyrophosphatase [Hoyosella subflava DQS3-9A1]
MIDRSSEIPVLEARSLRLVSPSLAAALGVPDFANELGLEPARSAGVLLLDGLGAELLSQHADDAPVLSRLASRHRNLSAGFPATTSTSVTALGTGLHAGEHGIIGYTFRAGTSDAPVLNTLRWCAHATKGHPDLRDVIVPETVQPRPTVFERVAAHGVAVYRIVPSDHHGSGLSRAVLRGAGHDLAADSLTQLADGIKTATNTPGRSLTYGYYGGIDLAGHIFGPGSPEWRAQLREVDATVARIAEELGTDTLLTIVADHGMIDTGDDRIDIDTEPDLAAQLVEIGGEPRVRHLHTVAGSAGDVLDTWRAVAGERAWIVSREEAISAGWFGPTMSEPFRQRLGDVIVAARDNWTFVRSVAEPMETALRGHHGSWTPREQLVPLIQIRA